MKKILLLSMALSFCYGLFAQQVNDSIPNTVPAKYDKTDLIQHKKFMYCDVMGMEEFLSSKINVEIDFGQEVKYWYEDMYYKDENGRRVSFNSMIDAMNFLGSLGWEFVQAYVTIENNRNVHHWIMKMEIKE